MKYFIPILFALLSFNACGNISQKNIEEKNAKTLSINVDDTKNLRMSDIFQDLKYIPLQVKKDQKIGRIEKIIVTDEYIALLDMAKKAVWLFTREGLLENVVSIPVGKGPGEVLDLIDFDIDQQNRIHGLGRNKMVIYSKGGELKNEFRMNYLGFKFTYLNNTNTYVLYTANSLFQNADISNLGNNLLFLNSSGDLEEQALPIDFSEREISFLTFNSFPTYNDRTLFFGHPTPKIYEITDKQVNLRYFLDFGAHAIPEEVYEQRSNYKSSIDFFENEVNAKGFASYIGFFLETETLINFVFNLSDDVYQVFIDKNNDEVNVTSNLINDIDYGLTPKFRSAFEDKLFTIIQPYDLLNKIEQVRKNNPEHLDSPKMNELIRLANGLSTYDNPIVMVAKINP